MRQCLSVAFFVGLRLLALGSGLIALLLVTHDGWLRTRGIMRFPAKLLLYAGLACLVVGPGVIMFQFALRGGQFPMPIWWVFVGAATTWPGLILTAYGAWATARERRRAQS